MIAQFQKNNAYFLLGRLLDSPGAFCHNSLKSIAPLNQSREAGKVT